MFMALLGPIVSALTSGVSDWWKHRTEVKTLERKTEIETKAAEASAKIEWIKNKQTIDAQWDAAAMEASGSSWKDEWLTILFSIPLILCFIPGMEQYVTAGFSALDRTPDWYQWSVLVIVAASFGYKRLVDMVTGLKK